MHRAGLLCRRHRLPVRADRCRTEASRQSDQGDQEPQRPHAGHISGVVEDCRTVVAECAERKRRCTRIGELQRMCTEPDRTTVG